MPPFHVLRATSSIFEIRRAVIFPLAIALLALLCTARASAVTPAVPYIDIVAPVSITPGSTGVTLTLLGAGFSVTTVVRWNGTALTTTFVSNKKLTAAVPDVFVAAVGLGTITAQTGSGVISNIVYVPVAALEAGTSFPSTPSSSVAVETFPQGIVAADFNGDGKIDLAVANNTDGTISVLLGHGDGTFAAGLVATAGSGANWIAVGDFDGDGKLDMAVANSGSTGPAGVTILHGNGNGTFTAGASLTTGDGPFAVATADFNGDGHLDLVVSNSNDGTLTVFLGHGDGTFAAGTTLTVGNFPQVIVVGDFDENGSLDLAVCNQVDNTVSLLSGTGTGAFGPQTTFSTGTSGFPIGLIAADFNSDSHLDLAAVNASTVGVLLGNGAGGFTLHETASTGTSDLIAGVAGDYNGDDKPDLVISDRTAGEAFFLPGVGDGTFGTPVLFTTASGAWGVATADFNGDGGLDLAITNGGANNVSIFLQQLPVSLSPTTLSFGNQNVGVASPPQTITLTNSSGGALNISSIAFTGADAPDFTKGGTCGATVPNMATCTITVTFTPSAAGALLATLTITDNGGNSPQTLAVSGTGVVSAPTIAKTFGAANIPLNATTSLSFTITNPGANAIALTGVAFNDALPAGLEVATPNGLAGTCGSGTITAIAGAGSVSLSGGTIAVSGSCTFSVNVTGVTVGAKANITAAVSSNESGAGAVSNTATVNVIAPPTIGKAFGVPMVALNGNTTLTFSLANPNSGSALSGIAFTDSLPAGLVVATPNGLTGSCGGGTFTATAASGTVSLSGAALAASATCTFAVNVTGTTGGAKTNVTGAITSTQGGTGLTASAGLSVEGPPIISKAFAVPGIALNGITALTFTVTNPTANTAALTGVAFSDTFPAGIIVATPNGLTGTCGGGTITAAAGSSAVSLAGATIATNTSCTFAINVQGTATGNLTNTSGAVGSTNGGTGNSAVASLNVATPPAISKTFGASTIPLNGATSLGFTVTNPSANSVALTGLAFTDTLTTGLVIATPNGLAGTCGGGTITAVAGSGSASLSGASLAPNISCTFSVNVIGSTAGVKANSVTISSANAGTGNTSNASVTVVAPPVLIKAFGVSSVALNGLTSLTFTVQNNNASASLSGIAFTDTLPTGLVISTPNGQTGTCGGGTITVSQATGAVSLSGATLAQSSSCTFAVNVTGTTAGTKNNTTGNISSVQGGTGGTASAALAVEAPPGIAKSFGATGIALGGSTSLAFTVTNPGANTAALTGVAFTDILPPGLVISTPNGLIGTCGGGTITAAVGSGSASLAGGSIPINSACTFSVNVTGTASGNFTNTTGAVSSTNGGTGNTATANASVSTPPTIAKSFGSATIPLNGSIPLSFTITNPAVNTVVLTGVSFTDTLPAGLVVSTPNGITGTCGGGTITAVASSGSVSLTGGSIPVNSSCTFAVNVIATMTGILSNTTGPVSATQSGGGAASNTASITVLAPPAISKSFGSPTLSLAGTTTLTFTISNPNATAGLLGVAFTDTMPSGLTVAIPNGLSGTCGAGIIAAAAGATAVTLSGGTISASSSCTFSVNVAGSAGGTQVNTTGSVVATNGGSGNTATSSIIVVSPDLTITKSHAGNFKQGQTGAIYNIAVRNAGTVPSNGVVTMTDLLPAGLTATAITGRGWNCTVSTAVCTRSDGLPGGAAYPVITLTVSVSGVAPASLTNTATVSGGGDSSPGNDTATDVTVIDVTAADFSIATSTPAVTIAAGMPATFTFTMAPLNNVPFSTPVSMTVTGGPANSSFIFEPASVTPGMSATITTLVVKTTAGDPYVAGNIRRWPNLERTIAPGSGRTPSFGIMIPVAGLALAGLSLRKRKNKKDRTSQTLLFIALACCGWGLYGCASGRVKFSQLGTPAGTYTLTVSASSGALAHSTPVTLTVQP
jgi:uncharacterized repeat protein (TIGR01451 family)